nr:MAG TPA: hypothetical protein [Caudoviricetes sp.]
MIRSSLRPLVTLCKTCATNTKKNLFVFVTNCKKNKQRKNRL